MGVNEKNDFFSFINAFFRIILYFSAKKCLFMKHSLRKSYYEIISFMAMSVSSVGICGRSWKGKAMPIL